MPNYLRFSHEHDLDEYVSDQVSTLRPGLRPEEVSPSAQHKCTIVFHYKQL